MNARLWRQQQEIKNDQAGHMEMDILSSLNLPRSLLLCGFFSSFITTRRACSKCLQPRNQCSLPVSAYKQCSRQDQFVWLRFLLFLVLAMRDHQI